MSDDNLNPASKSAQPASVPYLCPWCQGPCSDVQVTLDGPIAIIWHGGCKKVINIQVLAVPNQPRPNIVIPGRPS